MELWAFHLEPRPASVSEELFELSGRLPPLSLSYVTRNRNRSPSKLRGQSEALTVWKTLTGAVDFRDQFNRLLPGD